MPSCGPESGPAGIVSHFVHLGHPWSCAGASQLCPCADKRRIETPAESLRLTSCPVDGQPILCTEAPGTFIWLTYHVEANTLELLQMDGTSFFSQHGLPG